MTQENSIEQLQLAFTEFEHTASLFSETDFFKRPHSDKWSAAENADHLFHSVKGLTGLFAKPEIMHTNWGTCNRQSRCYEDIVGAYINRVSEMKDNKFISAPGSMPETKEGVLTNLKEINKKFLNNASLLTWKELDNCQVPHPLLGLLSGREFLYFTHYHTLRHWETIKKIALLFDGH